MEARVDFYHLTRDSAPPVAARLAERVLEKGRLLIVAGDAAAREAIDAALWSAIPHSFLPHPATDAPEEGWADEPILILPDVPAKAANGAEVVALADGRWRDAALDYARVLYLFDGAGIDEARAAWRDLARRDGVDRRYWSQTDRGWREGP